MFLPHRLPPRSATVPTLRIEVLGGDIIVTATGTDYVVTYHKPASSSQLIAKRFSRKEDRRVSMTLADFLTSACKLANDKARELGWIA